MMSNNQFMLATACLLSVALLSGCSSNTAVSKNSQQVTTPAETVTVATTTDAAAPPIMVKTTNVKESTATSETKVTEVTEITTADAPKVTTTKNGVTVIPLGATPEEITAATAKPVAVPNIQNIARELSHHHNTQWHSRSFTYRLYLGGQLNAEYSQEKNALTISSDASETNLACQYSTKHGGLASVDDTKVSACNTLANELQSYLEQD